MESPSVVYVSEARRFESNCPMGVFNTRMVLPTRLQEGDALPPRPLHLNCLVGDKAATFRFSGDYNAMTDNLQFKLEGPLGFNYKIGVSVHHQGSGHKIQFKRRGSTTTTAGQDFLYVPMSMCSKETTAATKVEKMQVAGLKGDFLILGLAIRVFPDDSAASTLTTLKDENASVYRSIEDSKRENQKLLEELNDLREKTQALKDLLHGEDTRHQTDPKLDELETLESSPKPRFKKVRFADDIEEAVIEDPCSTDEEVAANGSCRLVDTNEAATAKGGSYSEDETVIRDDSYQVVFPDEDVVADDSCQEVDAIEAVTKDDMSSVDDIVIDDTSLVDTTIETENDLSDVRDDSQETRKVLVPRPFANEGRSTDEKNLRVKKLIAYWQSPVVTTHQIKKLTETLMNTPLQNSPNKETNVANLQKIITQQLTRA